ncbi:unnamed protein product [Phytomonas sp. Hart1]|nr:unnamed protein product [Phytomonas sp. Hart1]|eukprot:CCW72214.1 unnamed protein product [Phytomonas sp. isolate Hart1]
MVYASDNHHNKKTDGWKLILVVDRIGAENPPVSLIAWMFGSNLKHKIIDIIYESGMSDKTRELDLCQPYCGK